MAVMLQASEADRRLMFGSFPFHCQNMNAGLSWFQSYSPRSHPPSQSLLLRPSYCLPLRPSLCLLLYAMAMSNDHTPMLPVIIPRLQKTGAAHRLRGTRAVYQIVSCAHGFPSLCSPPTHTRTPVYRRVSVQPPPPYTHRCIGLSLSVQVEASLPFLLLAPRLTHQHQLHTCNTQHSHWVSYSKHTHTGFRAANTHNGFPAASTLGFLHRTHHTSNQQNRS
jgi:hypothetical protein